MKLAEIINQIEHNDLLKYEDVKPRINQLKAYYNAEELFYVPYDSYGTHGIIATENDVHERLSEYLNELGFDSESERDETEETMLFNTIIL